MSFSCETFCKGGMNKNGNLISIGIDNEVQQMNTSKCHSFKGVKRNKDGDFLCPIGCSQFPTTAKASKNLKNNGVREADICHSNQFIFE